MFESFNTFLIRTPRLPLNYLKETPFDILIKDSDFKEAVYIASPTLYVELEKILENKINNVKDKYKIESALYRYITRMSSRSTPFGLFAGLSVGRIDDKTNIVLGAFKRYSRLDMQILCTLSQELSKLPNVKESIKYYSNTSIYKIGNLCRYVEYKDINSERKHQVVSVKRSLYLDEILKIARKGIHLKEILNYLVEKEIEYDSALKYVDDLIDSQILVNDLTPSVTGNDYFSRIIGILKELNLHEQIIDTLSEIREKLYELDFDNVDYNQRVLLYQSIIQMIKKVGIAFNENCLFQVDMIRDLKESTIGRDIVDGLKSAMVFLNRISLVNKKDKLEQFKQAFQNRYEDREIPLMEALDSELGIGYSISDSTANLSPLLNDFCMPSTNDNMISFRLNDFMSLLLKKTIEASKKSSNEIVFYDHEIEGLNKNWKDLPPTLYSMFNIISIDQETPLIYVHGFYGTSGAKILTRFAHTDQKINKFVDEIVLKENDLLPDKILAEIAYMPEPRIGNVVTRHHLRNYEIPYLVQSDLPENQIINVSDMLISIRGERICLRSKKNKKEIVPRLTNAHNYSDNYSLPVYRFLSDMQQQARVTNLYFDWGYLDNELIFFPRVMYKNIILSLATWKIKVKDIYWLINTDNDSLIVEIRQWREQQKLPDKMILSDYDNELLINWEEIRSIRALFSIIKNKDTIKLKEFIYNDETLIIKDEKGKPYINECIVAFYKKSISN